MHLRPSNPLEALQSNNFDKHVNELMKQWHVPGLAIALTHCSRISSKGFGLATIYPPKACTTDTLFDIASSSKSLTAAAVALLVADDKLSISWDSKMSVLLPDTFALAKETYTNDVTLEDILSHRSGLPRHDSSYLGKNSKTPDSAASVTRNLRNLPISASIRAKYQYNNMMFTVASHLLEVYGKMTFAEFLKKRLFGPLNMTSSFIHPSAAIAAGQGSRLATPYSYHPQTSSLSALTWPEDPESQGAGSVCTCVDDYILYIQALIQKQFPFTNEILNALISPRIFTESDNLYPFESWHAYGLGWRLYYYRGHQIVLHFGGISGFSSVHFFLPAFRFGGVMMGNVPDGVLVQEILTKELIDCVLDVPPYERVDWVGLVKANDAKVKRLYAMKREKLREVLLDGRKEPEEQRWHLEKYAGLYSNAGYHVLRVEIRERCLFIDATDRSMGFTLLFEHVHSQRVYLVRQIARDDKEDVDDLEAVFRFDENEEKVVAMGLHLEAALNDLIWFTPQIDGGT